MKEKAPTDALRLELAGHLEELARRLRQGEVAEDLKLSPGVEVNLHLKEKKGRQAAKVSLKWIPPAYATPDLVPCKDEGLQQLASFKEVKKRLQGLFQGLMKVAATGELPDVKQIRDFISTAQEFHRFAEPEWQSEMETFLEHTANLELAWNNRQLEMLQHELRDLQNQWVACHREHK